MEHIIDFITDEYVYSYLESLLSDPTTDEATLHDVFETWNIPTHLIPKILLTNHQPAPEPAHISIHIPKSLDMTSLFQEEQRTPRQSHVPQDIKRKILNSYDLRPITIAPCNPTLPQSPKANKVRYHNNQIVTNKGEKYVDLAKQTANSTASS